eukprot:5363213-Amphidinium_carterae.1
MGANKVLDRFTLKNASVTLLKAYPCPVLDGVGVWGVSGCDECSLWRHPFPWNYQSVPDKCCAEF